MGYWIIPLNFYLCVPHIIMKGNIFSKKLMLAGGILAALIIIFSQAFHQEACSFLSKIHKTEKPAEAEKKVIIATPADAVTSGPAVEVGDADPSFIREIILKEDQAQESHALPGIVASSFLRTLFRAIISPQAP